MNNHQGIKAEIDARNDSFTNCIELGKSLLARKHYALEEVRGQQFHNTLTDSYLLLSSVLCFFLHPHSPPFSLRMEMWLPLVLCCVIKCMVFLDSFNFISFHFQIKEKLLQLTDKRKDMIDKWEDRWEWLRLGNSIKSFSVCCTVLAKSSALGLTEHCPTVPWYFQRYHRYFILPWCVTSCVSAQFWRCTNLEGTRVWPSRGCWDRSRTCPAGRWVRTWMKWRNSSRDTRPLRSQLPPGKSGSLRWNG